MKVHIGHESEYERRHREIWPDLAEALHKAGVLDYTIWLDRQTGDLFALMHLTDDHSADSLPHLPAMKRWWRHMAEIMDANDDFSPVTQPLEQVFHLE